MKLHNVIKNLREDKGLTQEKLAENAKLTRGYISRLEKGTYADDSPSIKTLKKIADGLKEPLELILAQAGITQDDYIKSASMPTFLRAKYNLNEQQILSVESFIEHVKNQLKAK
ncbi:MAG: helix-turn-helix transcriptional regulator [Candidatus Taylorbacteria bacterium]